jgi:hypothetical protein
VQRAYKQLIISLSCSHKKVRKREKKENRFIAPFESCLQVQRSEKPPRKRKKLNPPTTPLNNKVLSHIFVHAP